MNKKDLSEISQLSTEVVTHSNSVKQQNKESGGSTYTPIPLSEEPKNQSSHADYRDYQQSQMIARVENIESSNQRSQETK
jgi:hypothetical protein